MALYVASQPRLTSPMDIYVQLLETHTMDIQLNLSILDILGHPPRLTDGERRRTTGHPATF